MKKKVKLLIPVVLIIAGLTAWHFYKKNGKNPNQIQVSGNIEVTQVDMAFKIPGRLAVRTVDEGEPITRGMLLAGLDDTDQKLQVKKAEAEVSVAKSFLAELESGSRRQEIQGVAAELKQAEAAAKAAASQLKLARDDFQRYEAVYQDGGISRQTFDTYHTRLETARNAKDEADARIQAVQQKLSLTREGPRQEALDQARARLATAEAALNLYRQQLAETQIFAPFDGIVLSKSAEPAAYLSPGMPVLTVAQIEKVWLRAFISETDLARIRIGQNASITTDAFPEKIFPGKISFISSTAEFTPKAVQTFEERVNLMYRIKIDLDNPDGELKPGMPADAVINVNK